MFMVLSSWLSQCESLPSLFDKCSTVPVGLRLLNQVDQLEPIDLPVGDCSAIAISFTITIYDHCSAH